MDWKKANASLANIQRLMYIFETSEGLSALEQDLLLRRIQDLYEIVLTGKTSPEVPKATSTPKPELKPEQKSEQKSEQKPIVETLAYVPLEQKIAQKVEQKIEQTPVIAPPPPKPAPVETVIKVEPPKPTPPPVIAPPPPKPAPVETVIKVEPPKPTPPPVIAPPPPKPAPVETVIKVEPPKPTSPEPKPTVTLNSEEVEALFEFKSATDLSERLSAAPLASLKTAMSINDRFLTISELFGGNAARYNEVIETLDGLKNFEQAKDFLVRVVISEFGWTLPKRTTLAKNFVGKVRRRFL